MVGISSDIIEIIVLPSGADTLLTVDDTFQGFVNRIWFDLPQEDALELIHSRVGEQKGGILQRNARRTGHVLMTALLLEVVNERLSHLIGRPIPGGGCGGGAGVFIGG
jgi:hypothetical protein